ncbi:hypothetical protein [uncultured Piscinibacter sp.]|uniref:hypothetical protein n=1 Tax=uncultured Piscinibacter sp. TaxID=1131835 RepID=UPI0026389419|nr:hypothetical protein [uncultured Piscinibacter sp.]
MDIVAHTLWAGLGAAALARRRPVARGTVAATMTLAALPDVIQMLPVLGWWWFGGGSLEAVRAFAIAMPGQEPAMPELVTWWSHTIHCIAHSAVIAAGATLLLWAWRRTLWVPLLGWWSHIVIDVFTHSADYYASPVLYPFTERGFDGIAWITPWFMALNYLALAAAGVALLMHRRRGTHTAPTRSDEAIR